MVSCVSLAFPHMAVGVPSTSTSAKRLACALELNAVSRVFGNKIALRPLTLTVAPATVTMITGPNGAGKTTLQRIAAGLLTPTSGARQAAGRAVLITPGSGARSVQTVREAVNFVSHFCGPGGTQDVMERVGLARFDDAVVGTLSSGQRSRLSLAIALTLAAPVTCLDEPTANLDDEGAITARDAVAALAARGAAVLVATHTPELFAPVADARLHLVAGRLLDAP